MPGVHARLSAACLRSFYGQVWRGVVRRDINWPTGKNGHRLPSQWYTDAVRPAPHVTPGENREYSETQAGPATRPYGSHCISSGVHGVFAETALLGLPAAQHYRTVHRRYRWAW